MPPHSRAQRRRQATRQQRRPATPAPNVEAVGQAANTGTTTALDAPASAVARQPARQQRRVLSRPTAEPVDYSKDYSAARRDLRWIAIWSVLLAVGMIALKFSGLV
jgi:hypothetical protein